MNPASVVRRAPRFARPSRTTLERHLTVLGFGAAIFALGDIAVRLAPKGSTVAAWWPAAGVAVAALVRYWDRRWTLAASVLIFSALANLAGGRNWQMSLGFGVANAAEALVAAWSLRRLSGGRPALRRLRDVVRLGVAATLGAFAIAAGVALTVVMSGRGLDVSVWHVVPSHMASVLLILPLTLPSGTVIKRSRAEVLGCWVADALAVAFVFTPVQRAPLAFVLTVPLVWAGIRLGVRSVSSQLLVMGIAVTWLTSKNKGPFALTSRTAAESNWSIQLFLISCALVAVALGTAVSERESALMRVRASEDLFRRGFDEALVGMMLVRIEGRSIRAVEVNPVAERRLGIRVDEPVTPALTDVAGRTLGDIATELQPGEGWRGEMDQSLPPPESARRFAVSLSRLTGDGSALATCQLVDVTERHRTEVEMERLALRDHLTGLPNRVLLEQRLSEVLEVAAETSSSVAVMFIDLDDFKMVNDTSGHHQGDHILVELGRRLAACVRDGDTVARMGGDEFVIVSPEICSSSEAAALAERIWAACEQPVLINDVAYKVDLSIGLALSRPEMTKSELLSQADMALYAAKAAGKRRLAVYTTDMGDAAAEQVRLEAELRTALAEGQLVMHVQPVVNIDDGAIVAAEALIRWNHPERGLLLPGTFIPVAERSGLMPEIGAWVLDESCREAARWVADVGAHASPSIHVNVSARQLDRLGLAEIVLSALERHGLPPDKLVLELTESYLAEIDANLLAEFELLTERGIRFAADDYGTGYSPLTRIIELPIAMIKIDQRFVRSVVDDPRALAIVSSLVTLADALDLEVVAEGVESMEHVEILRDLGVECAQGHVWHTALTPECFRELLRATLCPIDAFAPVILEAG